MTLTLPLRGTCAWAYANQLWKRRYFVLSGTSMYYLKAPTVRPANGFAPREQAGLSERT